MINLIFQYKDIPKRYRVINIIEDVAFIIDIDSSCAMPKTELVLNIEEGLDSGAIFMLNDPYLRNINEEKLSSLEKKSRDEAWEFINEYCLPNLEALLNKTGRSKELNRIAKDSNKSLSTVKRYISKYWQRGMNKNALLPDYINCGGRGKEKELNENKVGRPRLIYVEGKEEVGINITIAIKNQIEKVIQKYYKKSNQYSIKDAYLFLLRDYYSDSYKENGEIKYRIWEDDRIPSFGQFYYWFKKMEDPKKDIQLRISEKEYELKYRPLLSNSKQETNGPGTRFQIDATIADLYLVSSYDATKIIGRPVVYAVMDVYSRMMVGIYVGLEGPSWIGAMMALDNMIADKVEFCKYYDIEINEQQWPSKHLPEVILADRGEFEGYSVDNLINNINIKIENTPAYRGDLKGIVERKFRTINGKIKKMAPGAIQKEYRERGDKDYRLDATLNLKEFTAIIINLVILHNHKIIDKYPLDKEMLQGNFEAKPINLWNWGIQNKSGRLRTIDRDIFRLNILPKAKARITRNGIKFKGLFYGTARAIEEQWYFKHKSKTIDVVYDPRNIEKIYIPNNIGAGYEICTLLDVSQQYKFDYLEEVLFHQQIQEEINRKNKQDQNQLNIQIDVQIENIIKSSKKRKLNNTTDIQTKKEKLLGISENRAVEKKINRMQEKFEVQDEEVNRNSTILEVVEKDAEEIVSENANLMKKLRAKRGEQSGK